MLSNAQLISAAGGIAYRAQQLALIGSMMGREIDVRLDPPATFTVTKVAVNALVESGLVNARALAHFLGVNNTEDVAAAHYGATVPADLAKLTHKAVLTPVSEHLATRGIRRRWPIRRTRAIGRSPNWRPCSLAAWSRW